MRKCIVVILPALVFATFGYYLGNLVKESPAEVVVSIFAGAVGGGIAGYALLGVSEMRRASGRRR